MFVSSANKKNVSFFETFARSFMYSKNKRGPRTEPIYLADLKFDRMW